MYWPAHLYTWQLHDKGEEGAHVQVSLTSHTSRFRGKGLESYIPEKRVNLAMLMYPMKYWACALLSKLRNSARTTWCTQVHQTPLACETTCRLQHLHYCNNIGCIPSATMVTDVTCQILTVTYQLVPGRQTAHCFAALQTASLSLVRHTARFCMT